MCSGDIIHARRYSIVGVESLSAPPFDESSDLRFRGVVDMLLEREFAAGKSSGGPIADC